MGFRLEDRCKFPVNSDKESQRNEGWVSTVCVCVCVCVRESKREREGAI